MRKNYRKDLENAARQMILVHRVHTLSKLILRTIMRNIPVRHAGMFICDRKSEEYIITVSKGRQGVKVPVGFAKVKKSNPLIRYFTDDRLTCFNRDYLLYQRVVSSLRSGRVRNDCELKRFFQDLKEELSLYQAKVLIPGFYRENLVGILFLGAKDNGGGFLPDELGFLSVLASDVVMAIQNAWFFESLNEQLTINKQLFLNTVTALATAIEAKDKYTLGHTERVVKYSLAIARYLRDDMTVPDQKNFEENLRIAALLHDIGKIGVPEEILGKNAPLLDKEREHIALHPLIGSDILTHISEFKDVILGVKYHHERYDGNGYPFKLKGDEIPLIAAIIAVADTFDAMTSTRPYRRALPRDDAVREISQNSGKQFHPVVVAAFLEVMREEGEQKSELGDSEPALEGDFLGENG